MPTQDAVLRPARPPLHVLAMIDTYRVSGPCRGLFQLAKLLPASEVRLTFGLFQRKGSPRTPALAEVERRGVPLAVFVERRRYDPTVILHAWRLARTRHVRLVQSHGYKPAAVAWMLKLLTGMPWVAFVHGFTSEDRRVALYNRLDRWLTRRADRVVVMSAAMARDLVASGVLASRIRVVHNAIDPAEHQPETDPAVFRAEIRVSSDELLLGVIGRFSSEKGQALFLRAFAQIRTAVPRARAVFVGEGIDEPQLRRLVADLGLEKCVAFVGYRREMSAVYASLDLVVIPSLSEGLPNVLLEAMLHGKAVVASRVGAIPDVLTGSLQRWLVRPGDVPALAQALLDAATDVEGRAAFGRAGRTHVLEVYSPAARVAHIESIYRELEDGRPALAVADGRIPRRDARRDDGGARGTTRGAEGA